jgi:O-antigen/teichoic acid export membrane protein
VDEAISSVQNFVILVAALHVLSLGDLGRFTLAYTMITLAEVVLKAQVLTPLSMYFAAADTPRQRRGGADAAGATLLVGAVAAALTALVALPFGPPDRGLIAASGLAALALLAQESWRTYFIAVAAPWRAVANDLGCLVVTVGIVWWAVEAGADSSADLVLLLAAGTGFGFFAGIVQTRIVPSLVGGGRWLVEHWSLGIRVAGSRGAAQVSGRISLSMISAISGAAALGRLSASRTLMAPATTLVTAMWSFTLPEASRIASSPQPRLRRFLLRSSAGLTAIVLVIALVMALLPSSVGHLLAGDHFGVAQQLLLPVAIFTAANALAQGARVGIITLQRPGLSLRIATTTGVALVAAAALGAALDDARGAAWALAIVQCVQVVTWWSAFEHVVADRPTGQSLTSAERAAR